MKKLLDIFYPLLKNLNGDNLVLTGSGILAAHGLVLRRDVVDLDVVIFQPTPEQEKYLQDLSVLSVFKYSINQGYECDVERIKLVKFKKNDTIIDIFITKDKTPENLLYYKHNYRGLDVMFKVADIKSICDAKQSYIKYHSNMASFSNDKYNRQKDVIDLQNLKNDNFNVLP